jgi:predicted nucleic acid-binding protein
VAVMVETSAWVEFVRDTGSPVCERVDDLLDSDIAVSDLIRLEVLAGARDERHLAALQALLNNADVLPTLPEDHDVAASLYRDCRRAGETVRVVSDCLIAAVAIRAGVAVLHADRDFDVLARHTPLRSAS